MDFKRVNDEHGVAIKVVDVKNEIEVSIDNKEKSHQVILSWKEVKQSFEINAVPSAGENYVMFSSAKEAEAFFPIVKVALEMLGMTGINPLYPRSK